MTQGDLGILNMPGFTIGASQSSIPGAWIPLTVDAGSLSGRRIKAVQLPNGVIWMAETTNTGYYGIITMSVADAAGRSWKLIDIGGIKITLVQTTVTNVWAVLVIDTTAASAANYRTLNTGAGNVTLVETGTTGKRAVLLRSTSAVSGAITVASVFGRQFAFNGGALLNTAAVSYDWLDEFGETLAAGAVNGTTSTQGAKTRTVTDTENKLSLNGTAAVFAGGKASPAYGDPGLWYPSESRIAGKMLVCRVIFPQKLTFLFGWDTNQSSTPAANAFFFTTTIGCFDSSNTTFIGTFSTNAPYDLTLILRATGADYFIKGGSEYPATRFLWRSATNNTANLFATLCNNDSTAEVLYIGVPTERWLPTPLASDGFGGAWGVSDGLGHAEGITGGLGSGGGGMAWTTQAGTYGITSSKAQPSALSGGLAIATVDTGDPDVMLDVTVTRAGGNVGAVLRYDDANNYLTAYHDGTNARLVERVAGSDTTKITGAVALGAGRLRVILDGTRAELYLNETRVATGATLASAGASGKHGLYATDTGNTQDAFVVYDRY